MPSDAEELKCVRCGLEVRVNRDSFEIFERMHWVCFHFEFEHMGFDPDEECDAPDCPSSPFNSPPPHTEVAPPKDPATTTAPRSRSPAHRPPRRAASSPQIRHSRLDTTELLAMVP